MDLYSRVILLLLILQADVTGFLVVVSLTNGVNQNTFALLFAVDLVAFAMMSYIYRTERLRELPRRALIILGSAVIVAVFFSSLIFA